MYTDRDRDQILSDMLEIIRDDVDKREGSVVQDMLAPPAEEFEMLGYSLEAILENGFIDTAQAQYVDKRAMEYGLYRKLEEFAKGWVHIQDAEGTEINIDDEIFANVEGDVVPIRIVEYAVVPESGEITVQAIAGVGGVVGNISAYSELASVSLPNAVITNPIEFVGGVDEEPDEELKARVLLKARKPITSGNVYHYELWAREVQGISAARVTPLWDGPGTVKVTVIDTDGRAPTTEQVQAVKEHIESVRPVGSDVTVVAITEVAIDVTAALVLDGGLIAEDVQSLVEQSITEYLRVANTEIRYSQVARAVLRTEGVKDYTDITIGTDGIMGEGNVLISMDDVAVLGVVTLT